MKDIIGTDGSMTVADGPEDWPVLVKWGRWKCPYEGCEHECSDPDTVYVTCCGTDGHTVLLGPVENGHRWAEKESRIV